MRGSLFLLSVVSAALIGCGTSYSTGPSGGGGGLGHDSVTVGGGSFSPKDVAPNDTGLVVWTWHSGGITHNITFTEAITGSGDKSSGTFTHVFTTPGTYHYHCTIHSGMTGTVVVAAPSPVEEGIE